jgi:tetratricopeptide (TPR) repeat protein
MGVFALSLAILSYAAAPGVSFHDSGEFALAAASAGIPHPPGAPTWSLLASGFVRMIHAQDAARACNLFSALCGAATLALLFLLTWRWVEEAFPDSGRMTAAASGALAALTLLCSASFIEQSATAEQYTLLTALMAAFLLTAARRPAWAGVIAGLAIANHPSQVALVPALLWGAWRAPRRRAALATALSGLLIGLSVFLWLPLRSRSNPLMDWGDVETADRLLWALGRRQWAARPLSGAPPGFVRDWIASYDLPGQVGVAGLLLAAAGITGLFLRGRARLGLLALVVLPYAALLLGGHLRQKNIDATYIREYGVADWHLPLYLALALSAGAGFALLSSLIRRRSRVAAAGFATLLAGLLLASSAGAFARRSLRDFRAPQEFADALLRPVPPGAVVLARTDSVANLLAYEAWAHPRADRLWIAYDFYPIVARLAACAERGERWSASNRVWHLTKTVMNTTIQPLRIPPLTSDRAENAPLFTEFSPAHSAAAPWLLPAGLLFEVRADAVSDEEVLRAEEHGRAAWPALYADPPAGAHRLAREAWSLMHQCRGAFFAERRLWQPAREAYALALRWMPGKPAIWYCLGDVEERLGRMGDAAAAYENAIRADPRRPGPRINLAVVLANQGQVEEARRWLTEELKLDPGSEIAAGNLKLLGRR